MRVLAGIIIAALLAALAITRMVPEAEHAPPYDPVDAQNNLDDVEEDAEEGPVGTAAS